MYFSCVVVVDEYFTTHGQQHLGRHLLHCSSTAIPHPLYYQNDEKHYVPRDTNWPEITIMNVLCYLGCVISLSGIILTKINLKCIDEKKNLQFFIIVVKIFSVFVDKIQNYFYNLFILLYLFQRVGRISNNIVLILYCSRNK